MTQLLKQKADGAELRVMKKEAQVVAVEVLSRSKPKI